MDQQQKQYAEDIRRQYEPKTAEETKLEQLLKLDAKVRRPAEIFAYVFGVVGALVLGIGMCLAMKVIGDMMIFGIVVGVVGIAMVSANYFIYRTLLNSRKNRYANEIMTLSDSILNK